MPSLARTKGLSIQDEGDALRGKLYVSCRQTLRDARFVQCAFNVEGIPRTTSSSTLSAV